MGSGRGKRGQGKERVLHPAKNKNAKMRMHTVESGIAQGIRYEYANTQ